MNDKDFIELKVQLARIEENVSQLPEVKKELKAMSSQVNDTHARSIQNEKDIERINGTLTWTVRTLGATIISVIAGIIFKM